MKHVWIVLVIAAAFAGGLWYGRRSGAGGAAHGKSARKILYWVDPMHPAYKSDKPGIAPDCGMKLEPVYADGGAGEKAADNRPILYYHDPAQPDYHADQPGLNPETGNELVPVRAGDVAGSVQVTEERQQLIGVKYGVVTRGAGTQQLRAVGKVEIDERLVSHVHSRTEGWIEEVNADFTGRYVKPNETLLTIYSPELVASQQEYLLALRAQKLMASSSINGAAGDSQSMVEAARRRLRHWELTDAQIAELERTGKPLRSVPLTAGHGGFITARNAFPHQKVMPDTDLYTIADLSLVWIVADVYESDASRIRMGQTATVKLSYDSGTSLRARVSYILPQVDPQTRTLKVRLEARNPGGRLKPEKFVDVDFDVTGRDTLLVPSEAILDTGLRKTVFVARGEGIFEPRMVETGQRFGNNVEVLHGLKEGERIVVSGNFLLDSESQLKASATGVGGHSHD